MAATTGRVRALVLVTNAASLKMFRRLGFAETGRGADPFVELVWRPPA